MRRFALLSLGVIAALSVAAAAGSAGHITSESAPPVTLVSEEVGIWDFAQDGDMLAWQTEPSDTRSTIKVRAARGGKPITVSRPDGGDGPYDFDVFGLGGRRVVWAGFVDCCNNGYGTVETAAPGSKPKELRSLYLRDWAEGDYPTGAAGRGGTLVYSLAAVGLFHGSAWAVTGGDIWRVVGRKAVRVPGAPPAAVLAAAQGTIALVPADRHRSKKQSIWITAAPNARVEIRDAVTGMLRASFAPRGTVAALGMDEETVAVIVRSDKKARVEWYSARSGMLLGATGVPRDVVDTIDVSGPVVVFRRNMIILALDMGTAQIRELARASSKPFDLSIEGTRVAWVETTGGDKYGSAVGALSAPSPSANPVPLALTGRGATPRRPGAALPVHHTRGVSRPRRCPRAGRRDAAVSEVCGSATTRVDASSPSTLGTVANQRELGARREDEHRVTPAERDHPGRVSVTCDLLGQQAERRLMLERVRERAEQPRLVTDLSPREPEPEGRDDPRVPARVVVSLVTKDASIGELQLLLDGGDRGAHPGRVGIDRAERPAQPEEGAVHTRVLSINAADRAGRIAQATSEDRRR